MVLSLSVRVLLITLLFCVPQCCLAETVLLDFSSPSCGPCQQMRPIVQRLVADGLPVREIDISREPQLATRFGVTQVPTFLVVTDGRVVDQVVGRTTYEQLHRMLRRAMPQQAPRQPARPLGQSPGTPSTLADQPANIATVSGIDYEQALGDDLAKPQAGRVISLQNPNAPPSRPRALANPFNHAQDGPIAPVGGSPSSSHLRLLASTVKIAVEDAEGKSVGTGTIVDARSGEALILTCGHLFRTSAGKGPITVTTFQVDATGATPGASYQGRLIDFDLERDLALVSMRPTTPVPAVPIAAPRTAPLTQGAEVTSVGCNHGQNPTAIDSRVAALNRYQGPPNVEVAGAPVEGRSGGGLFNALGQLVGVCYAADPQADEGLYAALSSIHAKLDSLSLRIIYQPEAVGPQVAQETLTAVRGQEPEPPNFSEKTQTLNPEVAALSTAEQAALEEIQRRGVNSEVICIIRPQDPNGKSEVITLRNASPALVRALSNSAAATGTR